MERLGFAHLFQLEMEVREDLENVLNHEELLWKQKARCGLLNFGDYDLVTFCKVDLEQSQLINNILTQFCGFAGLRISTRKRNIFFSKGVDDKLSENWVHLFTDGAVDRGFGAASAGGVLRDQNKDWILGYNHYVKKCMVFEAEVWGILDGMLISLSKGFNRVMIHSNNLEVVQAL
ncbi:hypothetical protein Godav_023151 [Gossypium davidsonii]|uniref:RNase H type-1 domain-containing protein n=1 Tax=Gossypium davidsonii TaxID=34287 RepID=A0A7J8SS72_GOSDV|nr:hypothetical protein [Gossypium davidsonii]